MGLWPYFFHLHKYPTDNTQRTLRGTARTPEPDASSVPSSDPSRGIFGCVTYEREQVPSGGGERDVIPRRSASAVGGGVPVVPPNRTTTCRPPGRLPIGRAAVSCDCQCDLTLGFARSPPGLARLFGRLLCSFPMRRGDGLRRTGGRRGVRRSDRAP